MMPDSSPDFAFTCQKCGHCCQGKGGIVLAKKDIERLAAFLNIAQSDLLSQYAEKSQKKPKLKTGLNGYCIFFKPGAGCDVHPAKPDVCRAWPFFRGNLEDPLSLALAKDYCPGINKVISYREFRKLGLSYLKKNDLIAKRESDPPNALAVEHLLD